MSHRSVPPRATEPIVTPIVTYHDGNGGEPITGLLARRLGAHPIDAAVVIITNDGAVICPTTGMFSLQRVDPWCV